VKALGEISYVYLEGISYSWKFLFEKRRDIKSGTLGWIIRSRHKNRCFLDMKIFKLSPSYHYDI
jgi:hypothetical protein